MEKSLSKFAVLLSALCLFPAALSAQITSVSATIVDANGTPYSYATVKAQLITPGGGPVGNPTVASSSQAQCQSAGQGSAPCQIPIRTDAGPFTADVTGTFSGQVWDNTQITPASTQWLFTVNDAGIPPPLGTGPQTFSTMITISGASQDISSTLSGSALKLSNISAGPPLVQQASLTLSSAQILAMSAGTAYQVIAAPGVGKYIAVLAATIDYKFGTVAYNLGTTPGTFDLVFGTTDAGVGTYESPMSGILNQSVSTISTAAETPLNFGTGLYARSSVENQPISIGNGPGASTPTAGNGTVRVTIWYSVINLQ